LVPRGGQLGRVDSIATIPSQRASILLKTAVSQPRHAKGVTMFRDVILWLAGVPIFVIILLHLFGVFH
jgi:hypothetical protein